MNLKLVISLSLAVSVSTFFSACTNVERKTEEVVIDSRSGSSSKEVFITKSDTKKQQPQEVPSMLKGSQLAKRVLSDNSSVETVIDGFGNKRETRYFKGNQRVRCVILRTSVKGVQQVTVLGYGDSKTVEGLGDWAMSASAEEIAAAAQLSSTRSFAGARNFMKKGKGASQPPLQPLPSSAFQQPLQPVNQPAATVQPQTSGIGETTTQPNPPEEN